MTTVWATAVVALLAALVPAQAAELAAAPMQVFYATIDETVYQGQDLDVVALVGTEDVPATGEIVLKDEEGAWLDAATLADGAATLTLSSSEYGLHWLEVSFPGDGQYGPVARYIRLQVLDSDPCCQWIDRMYYDILHRNHDAEGYYYWYDQLVEAGVPTHVMSYAMLHSDEFAANEIYGEYWRFFEREPDAEGAAYYLDLFRSGMPVEYLGVDLVDSREFYERAGGTDEAFIAAAYAAVLYREVDDGGLEYYLARLDAGAGYDDVAYSLLMSDEALRGEIAHRYLTLLRRAPDEAGLAYWVGQVRRGFSLKRLVYELVTTPEYVHRAYAR